MIRVRVPATSANLGPGFDSLGLALGLYNWFECGEADGLVIEGCPPGHGGPDNLFVVAFRRACEELGRPFRGLSLRIEAGIPMARGLGSSAACIAGGLLAASAMAGGKDGRTGGRWGALGRDRLLDLASGIEGHPDNVAPAILGGFCASLAVSGKVHAARSALGEGLRFEALVPPFPLSTQVARAALPKSLPLRDAVGNIGGAALLSGAFAKGDGEELAAAIAAVLGKGDGGDRLHEPYRAGLIPGFAEVREAAYEAGAIGAYLSGAGPTIMAVIRDRKGETEAFAKAMEPVLSRQASGPWTLHDLAPDNEGSVIEWAREE